MPANGSALTGGPAVETRWRLSGHAHPLDTDSLAKAYGLGCARASAAGRAGQSNALLEGIPRQFVRGIQAPALEHHRPYPWAASWAR